MNAGTSKAVYVVGTFDTKSEELRFVADIIRQNGHRVVLASLSTTDPNEDVDVTSSMIAAHHPDGENAVFTGDRGSAVAGMGVAFERYISSREDIGGIISLGGSGGTMLATQGMRALPIGVPKLMVSTLAAGDVSAYVGPSDITMMNSVTDVAGINRISRVVLSNAANAMSGMMAEVDLPEAESKPAIGLTMFGVTTPCVTKITELMADDYECLVFHATGIGGQSMEKLADCDLLAGVIDTTTTEVCDLLFGGVLAATEDRLGAIARTKVPYIGSVGALDMVNFTGIETVPEKYKDRNLYPHNPQITLMRTTPEECAQVGAWLANKLNQCEGPVRFLIPEGGISMLDAPGQQFHDPQANAALFGALEANLIQTDNRQLIRLPFHINDPEFSAAMVDNFAEIAKA